MANNEIEAFPFLFKQGKRVMCKNTFLYRKLEKLNSESSLIELKAGWINKSELKNSRLILLPIHKDGNHWVLGNAKRLAQRRPLNYNEVDVPELRYGIAMKLLESNRKKGLRS